MFRHHRVGVPDYTTLSRRTAKLQPTLENLNWTRPTHVVIDATGLKVYGEGEWHFRTHGKSKRRTWRKFHVAINRQTLEFISVDLTESNVHDSKRTTKLLEPLFPKPLSAVTVAYDNCNAYDAIVRKSSRAIIPPRSGAGLKRKNISWGAVERNRNILENHRIGKDAWKRGSGYSRRSLIENAIGRYKRIITPEKLRISRQKSDLEQRYSIE